MISYTLKKHICIWLLLICMFSGLMTCTLAWQDYSQHKSNEFSGITLEETGGAVLVKLDKETDDPLEGVVFELYMIVEGLGIFKVLISYYYYKKGNWIKSLT